MKKLTMLLMTFLFTVAFSGIAHAVPLAIGGSAIPTGASSPGGDPITSLTLSFSGIFGEISGNVTQNVLKNDTGILFEYIINSTGLGSITQATASFYDSFMTDVDGPVLPYTPNIDIVTRGVDGETVSFGYIGDAILQGESSGTLWVQTNAPWYTNGGFSLIGADTATLVMYGPNRPVTNTVPEPASMALLGTGLVGLVFRKKNRS